jgi:hypothetical protein
MIAILLVLFLANPTATVENSALFNMAGGHVVFYLSISLSYLTAIPGSITFVVYDNEGVVALLIFRSEGSRFVSSRIYLLS